MKLNLVRRLVALRAHRAPPGVRAPARTAWARRWWSMLSVSVQQEVGGRPHGPDEVLDLLTLRDPAACRCAERRRLLLT